MHWPRCLPLAGTSLEMSQSSPVDQSCCTLLYAYVNAERRQVGVADTLFHKAGIVHSLKFDYHALRMQTDMAMTGTCVLAFARS